MVTSVVIGGKTSILLSGISARYAPSRGAPRRPRIASRKEVYRIAGVFLLSFKVQANFREFKRKLRKNKAVIVFSGVQSAGNHTIF
jgi:hypothetical protein